MRLSVPSNHQNDSSPSSLFLCKFGRISKPIFSKSGEVRTPRLPVAPPVLCGGGPSGLNQVMSYLDNNLSGGTVDGEDATGDRLLSGRGELELDGAVETLVMVQCFHRDDDCAGWCVLRQRDFVERLTEPWSIVIHVQHVDRQRRAASHGFLAPVHRQQTHPVLLFRLAIQFFLQQQFHL